MWTKSTNRLIERGVFPTSMTPKVSTKADILGTGINNSACIGLDLNANCSPIRSQNSIPAMTFEMFPIQHPDHIIQSLLLPQENSKSLKGFFTTKKYICGGVIQFQCRRCRICVMPYFIVFISYLQKYRYMYICWYIFVYKC